jgi:hypothetical protein
MFPRLCALGLLFTLALPSCLPILGTESLAHKSCVASTDGNTLVFKIETAGDLPPVISGVINQSLSFDECQPVPSSLFNIGREDNHHATLTVIASPGTKVGDEYFDQYGQPIPGTALTYYLYGRNYCGDDPLTFKRDQLVIAWNAEYASGSDCPISNFTSTIE